MARRIDDLSLRREMLVSRSAQQRAEILSSSKALRPSLQKIDHGVQFVKNLRHHPGWIAGLLIAGALIKPHRMLAAVEAARVATRTFGMVEPILNRLRR